MCIRDRSGEVLTQLRESYVASLQEHLVALLPQLLPSAGEMVLTLSAGWKRQELALADALLLARERDLSLGYTSVGPHRADLRFSLQHLPGREGLSRGQTTVSYTHLDVYKRQSLRCVATDGHRLALCEAPLDAGQGGKRQIIVPRKGVQELQRLSLIHI